MSKKEPLFSREEKHEGKRLGILALILIPLLAIVGLSLGWFGVFGERIIFKNSYQYHEARESAISSYEAQLIEIDSQLRRADLDKSTRNNLEAQARAIRVRLKTERGKR